MSAFIAHGPCQLMQAHEDTDLRFRALVRG
jgi:hypothetical protein